MHLSRLLAHVPGVVKHEKLVLVLTLDVVLLENLLICCVVLLHCVDSRLILFIPLGCISICSRSGNGDGHIVDTLVVSSSVKTDVSWSLRKLTFSRLPLSLFRPLSNGTTPVE